MRVISRARLRQFWESRKDDSALAMRSLLAWEKIARGAAWSNWGQLTQTFGSADRVGNCVVFDVGNNRFRLIARVNFDKGRLYILRVMDHGEYDKARWVESCRCHQPPPRGA
ncbi:type II toxin-antitoxin system HigB family toxin [Tundrisphaera sp. TA3]|uniref:type II toxin-antitoxin system HigB family toxin n=1 Tax=Tundrisphaera sp. TA3 TaxID=3435775 RepID=UPI003EB7CF2D